MCQGITLQTLLYVCHYECVRYIAHCIQSHLKLDPVGPTVRYEVLKLCTDSVKDNNNGWYLVVPSQYKAIPIILDCIGSV